MPEALISRTTSLGPGVGSGNSLSSSFRSPRNTTPFIRSSMSRVGGTLTPADVRSTLLPLVVTNDREDHDGSLRDADLHASRRQDERGGQALYRAWLPGTPEGRA